MLLSGFPAATATWQAHRALHRVEGGKHSHCTTRLSQVSPLWWCTDHVDVDKLQLRQRISCWAGDKSTILVGLHVATTGNVEYFTTRYVLEQEARKQRWECTALPGSRCQACDHMRNPQHTFSGVE